MTNATIGKTAKMMTFATAATFLGASALTAVSEAMAQSPQKAQATNADKRMSWSQLTSKLESAGYQIREIDQKHRGWKADVTDTNNGKLELHLDNQGNITHQKPE